MVHNPPNNVRYSRKGLIMTNITTPIASQYASVTAAKAELIAAVVSTEQAKRSEYGARRVYAAALNEWAGFAWFTFQSDAELKKVSPEFAREKADIYAALKAAECSNPSKIWGDIKKYGEEDARANMLYGFEPEPEVEAVEGEAEGAGANVKKTVSAFIMDDKGGLLYAVKRIGRDQASEKDAELYKSLKAALIKWGCAEANFE